MMAMFENGDEDDDCKAQSNPLAHSGLVPNFGLGDG